jgi:hypothetical protein
VKILVSGSYNDNIEGYLPSLLPAFRNACETLAAEILSNGHTLIVSTSVASGYEYADPYLLRGAEASATKASSIEVYAPTSKELADHLASMEAEPGDTIGHFSKQYPKLGAITHPLEFRKNWQTGQAVAVSRCDAAIIVGGNKGAATIAALADAMGKPIVGVPQFGGVGQEYFRTTNKAQLPFVKLDAGVVMAIEQWSNESPAAYMKWVKVLVYLRNRKSLLPAYAAFFVIVIGLCAAWYFLYSGGFIQGHWLKLLPLACCSSLVGWALNFVYNLQSYSKLGASKGSVKLEERASREFVVVSIVALAYGFLACEASRFYGKGINSLPPENLEDIAGGLSVLGFGVGLAFAEAYNKLRQKLSEPELG